MKRIAVLTSGGDAPGMNAAVRSVVRGGVARGFETYGVRNGFLGLIRDEIEPLGAREVGGILHLGGTVLGSARCEEFRTDEGRATALANLRRGGLDALVVIGGNGSQQGAAALAREGFPVVGIASTIDNDLFGTDVSLGVDTALNVALDAIDKLRATASSHHRAFAVEVMGRDCGYLALMAGIAGGAECVVLPEAEIPPEEVAAIVRSAHDRGKKHAMIVVAEGADHDADDLMRFFQDNGCDLGFRALRSTRLGHVQRGGTPSAFDRILAARFGAAAIESIARDETGVLVGLRHGRIERTPLEEVVSATKPLDPELIELARTLAT